MAPRGGSAGPVAGATAHVVAPVGARADALTVLRAIYRDPSAELAKRLDAAKAALPYEHQRKAKDDAAPAISLSITIELGAPAAPARPEPADAA